MLDQLLFCDDGISGFIDKLRNGRYDKEQGVEVRKAILQLFEEIRRSDIENSDIADLCGLMFFLRQFSEEFEELQDFEDEILQMIDDLY